MNTEKNIVLLDASTENIEKAFEKIRQYTEQSGYQIIGDLKTPTNMLGFSKGLSKCQKKVLRHYLTRIDKKIGMHLVNTFLHFLFRKIYKADKAPYVEYSKKELKIKSLRKQWKKAFEESEKLRLAYREEKGNFYKSQLAKAI